MRIFILTEKRRKQASESKLILHDPLHKASLSEESEIFLYEMDFPSVPPLPSPNPPPSDSSGYQSGSEDSDENMPVDSDENTPVSEEVSISEDNSFLDAVDDLLKNPDSYINALNNITMVLENNYSPNGIIEDSIDPIPISPYDISENSIDTVPIPPNVITEDKHDVVPFDIKLNGKFLSYLIFSCQYEID